ncbi:hypothetical protein POM88_028580 [Heracleum sosnowskyi]|uniref:TF-B3 domain-containing protein n=1 Tax=Heracleum sosnowskyi TaxID=360622 RepID=A0AAD8HTW1_9APIA|nr:hypothetical protein POM88_028580 [Heracleum sosnowskyi]
MKAPKCLILVSPDDCGRNELSLPRAFRWRYQDVLPLTLKLKLRTGYEIWVDRMRGIMKGTRLLLRDMNLEGGELLLLEYCGDFDFVVYVIGVDGCELKYPRVLHEFQGGRPCNILIRDGGVKFVKRFHTSDGLVDSFDPPVSFVKEFGSIIPSEFEYVVSDGRKLMGSYCIATGEFSGLHSVWELLGFELLNSFHILVFTYDGGHCIHVDVFDNELVEKFGDKVCRGASSSVPPEVDRFEISVQPCHMLRYNYGVDVTSTFKNLRSFWGRRDHITVFDGSRSWKLQIRKRSNCIRTTINDGWVNFRDDLGLKVGDIVKFETVDDDVYKFVFQVEDGSRSSTT